MPAGVLQEHKFENALTIDRHSWGYRRDALLEDFLSMEELLQQLASTVRYITIPKKLPVLLNSPCTIDR